MSRAVCAVVLAAGALVALAATLTLAQTGNDPFAPRWLPPAAVPEAATSVERIDRTPPRPRERPEPTVRAESGAEPEGVEDEAPAAAADDEDGRPVARPGAPEENEVADGVEDEGDDGEEIEADAADDKVPTEIDISKIRRPSYDRERAEACEQELLALRVKFEVLDPIEDDEDPVCGHPRPLKVRSIDGVKLRPEPIMRCETAMGVALWMRNVVVPSAELHLDTKPTVLGTTGSYQCRKRRSASRTRYSEHAFANALDIGGISFARRDRIRIKERRDSAEAARAFQAAIRGGACAYFTTVIGPMTNQAHSDHLHLDLAERRGGYRVCE